MVATQVWNPWLMAAESPGRTAVVAANERMTFAELTALASALASGLMRRGVPEGAVVATSMPSGPAFFALALATLRAGYGLFPISGDVPEPLRTTLLKISGAVLDVWQDDARDAEVPRTAVAELAAGPLLPWPSVPAGHLVWKTSGTTGRPAVVARTRPWYGYRGVAVFDKYFSGPELGPHVMANPTFHLGTLGPALYALQAGSAVVVQKHPSPSAFAALVDEHRADSAFMPPGLLALLVESGLAPRHALKIVSHGGSPCGAPVKHAAIELLGPVLHEYYGTSAGVISEISTEEWLRRPGSVGRPLPGVRVSVLDRERVVAPGETGEIQVVPRSVDRRRSEQILHTGDVGRLDDDGYLHVLGRISPDAGTDEAVLENLVRSLTGVSEVVVLSDPPRCHVEAADTAGIEGSVRSLARQVRVPEIDVQLWPLGALPRTPSGKVQRAALIDEMTTAREM
ncbi:class I adenylate-forming enzyme family protein [Nonomuraea fuscirosea]|uniref:class I adenylate-forming enzyme family protein n=1 Tax=Nonomuraea fuscirosea TaxID=1291556 RepID=UPI0034207CBA